MPGAKVHAPWGRFALPAAPLLAARREGATIPPARVIAAARPKTAGPGQGLVVETFGSPLSPLGDEELQVALIQALDLPSVLVSPSAVGAIGRTLQCLRALESYALRPAAVILIGPPDPFAVEQIARHAPLPAVYSVQPPAVWDAAGVSQAAEEQHGVIEQIAQAIFHPLTSSPLHPFTSSPLHPLTPSPAHPLIPASPPTTDKERSWGEILEADRRYVWHPYTSLREPDPPLVVVSAQDEFLRLADGREVIDGISSWWTILHGHRHPRAHGRACTRRPAPWTTCISPA